MTLIATKIAEVVDAIIASGESHQIWRGLLDTQQWKIVVTYNKDNSEFSVRAVMRNGSGEPE